MTDISNAEARRISLAAQGLLDRRPETRPGPDELHATLRQMGLVQLDTINTVARSHYIPFFSRLGPYSVTDLDSVTWGSGKAFEYWGHVASIMPSEQFPLFRYRMEAMRQRWTGERLTGQKPGYIESVLAQVKARGPLRSADLDDPGEKTSVGMWARGHGKEALEHLFAWGEVTASHRINFSRYYDLPERVLAPGLLNGAPTKAEAQRELLLIAAGRLGVATASDLADFHRLNLDRPPEARLRIRELVDAGLLQKVSVEGWREAGFVPSGLRVPEARPASHALLTPFDPIVWKRDRALRIFGFDYRIEIYVPEKKRKYGYYVLPFLLDGRLAARVDLKVDRAAKRLLARAAYLEPGEDEAEVAAALASELRLMAGWLGLPRVVVGRRGDMSDALRKELNTKAQRR